MRLVLLSLLAAFGLSGCLYGVPQGGYGGDPYGYPGGRYPGGYDGYGGQGGYGPRQVRCESTDNRTRRCAMDTSGGVQVARRLSDAPCVRGRSWDYDRNGVWVSHGCRAEFVAGYGRDPYVGGGYGSGNTFRCESGDMRLRRCPADTRDGVTLVRQLSDSRCIQGQTWGWDARGVWVDRGCRGEFRSGGGRHGNDYGGGYPGYGSGARTVRCESNDKRLRRCDMTIRGARLQRQLSDARCVEGRSWGWDRRGIWVSDGCRAEFAVW